MSSKHVLCAAAVAAFVAGASADDIEVLADNNYLFRYDTETGALSRGAAITGLLAGERVRAIDTGSGHLYALTEERLYAIDGITRVATPAGPRFDGARAELYRPFAFDFAPGSQVARLLVGTSPPGAGPVTGTRSLTLDARTLVFNDHAPETGSTYPLVYAEGDPGFGAEPIISVATHRFDPDAAGAIELIGIDTARNTLVRIGPDDADPATAEANVVTTIVPLTGLGEGETILALDMSSDGPLFSTPIVLTRGDWHTAPYASPTYSLDPDTGVLTRLPDMGTRMAIDIASLSAWPVEPAAALELTRFAATIDLEDRNRSSATLAGKIEIPAGGWEGKTLRVDFGGVLREFQLDSRGRGTSGRDSFKVSRKPRNGTWRFTLQLRRGNLRELGIRETEPPTGTVPVVVDMFVSDPEQPFSDVAYRAQFGMDYYVNRAQRAIVSRHAP